MTRKKFDLEVNASPELIGEIVTNAVADGLLCERCTALVNSRVKAEQPIEQNEICLPCQALINQFLQAEIERRVHEEMKKRGIPTKALQIGTKQ
jgi:hypothetical protein